MIKIVVIPCFTNLQLCFTCRNTLLYGKKDHCNAHEAGTLSLNEQKTKFQALDEWFSCDQGFNVSRAFSDQLQALNDLLYGDTLLQLGSCGNNHLFCKFSFRRKWIATPYAGKYTTLITSLNQLPLDRNSVDCILVPLTLDAFSYEKSPIDEIDRILKPMGYVIFFGVNPFSLWGYWLHYSKKSCFGSGKVYANSVFSVKRAMLHRGYIQCHLSSFYYIPPVTSKKLINKLEIFNELGKMISPLPAGFYCLVVQKHEDNLISLSPIKAKNEVINSVNIPLQPIC